VKIARIVCGIEPGGHGVGAAVRAARIAPDEAPLVLVGAADIGAAAMAQPLGGDIDMGPMPAGPWTSLEDLEDAVRADLERAERALGGRPGVATRIQVGSLAPALEEVAADGDDTLLALDAPHEGRVLGILDGDPGTWLLHESARPVLLARGPEDAGDFPRVVVAGVDGSAPSAVAAEAAGEIARRRGAELRLVVARGGRGVDRDAIEALRERLPAHELVEDPRNPVHALAGAGADLIVVGSRGLHGLRALGSVSERVAHGAEVSVLVAR
jgi:nucleotide-binding universal stress UspA family protein